MFSVFGNCYSRPAKEIVLSFDNALRPATEICCGIERSDKLMSAPAHSKVNRVPCFANSIRLDREGTNGLQIIDPKISCLAKIAEYQTKNIFKHNPGRVGEIARDKRLHRVSVA